MTTSSRRYEPLLFLIFLTPMVEFLTGSTNFLELLVNPFYLLLFLLVTLPNYALSAILVREALIAWKRSWASLSALGIAYGAINEGLMAKTYFVFQSTSPPLGSALGVGHLFGINWPWVTGITLFHMIVSMSVPVALSLFIFPDAASQRLLGRRGTTTALGLLVAQIVVWNIILPVLSPVFRQGVPLLLLPVAIVLVFTYLARRLPKPDPGRKLLGIFGRPLSLAVAAFIFFILTFAPILRFFAFPFIPTSSPYDLVYQADPTGTLATFYPMVLGALAVAFFVRYSLSGAQLLALLAGVMVIPVVSGLAPFDLPVGAPVAGLIYIACFYTAWVRIHARQPIDLTVDL